MFRKGIDVDKCPSYEHEFSNRRPVYAHLYPIEYLPEFRAWFHEEWLPKQSIKYFEKRYRHAVPVVRAIIARLEYKPKKND